MHGSNEWAIAPARSATGNALLMSNSHLQWGDIHTYFEVQLTAPGVTSYGAVWVGFPVLRQCFTEYVGWTQTTNNPSESDLYKLVLKDGGYVLDGQVKQFDTHTETIEGQAGRRHDEGRAAARAAHRARPRRRRTRRRADCDARGGARPAEDVRAVLAHGSGEELPGMGRGDAHAAAAALQHRLRRPRRPHRLHLQRDAVEARHRRLPLLAGRRARRQIRSHRHRIVPYDEIPKVIDPPQGWIQNSNDMPWTSTYPMTLDPKKFAAGFAAPQGITQRAQRGTRILSTAPEKITFENVKSWKLSTRVETADQFVDEIVATAKARGTARAKTRGRRAGEVGSAGRSRTATGCCSSSSS